MKLPQLGVPPLANHLAATHNNSSDERIGTDSTPAALRKLQRSRHVSLVRACELGFHETD
jgi:hypothetical protein